MALKTKNKSMLFIVIIPLLTFLSLFVPDVYSNPIDGGAGADVIIGNAITPGRSEHNGAATYQIPVLVPPGRGGISYNLALIYNSGGKNGVLGVGWGLNHSFIQRSTKNGLCYDCDEFVVNGSAKLVKRSEWGLDYFGLEIENGFTKYYYDRTGNMWIATTKDGTKYFYGSLELSYSKVSDGDQVFAWYLDAVLDKNGNFLTVTYSIDRNAIYLDHVDYTYHLSQFENADFESVNQVKFYYEDRPDINKLYLSNSSMETAYRLKTIEVLANGETARAYSLYYENSPYLDRSLLAAVKQWGSDAEIDSDGNIGDSVSRYIPPYIEFEYEDTSQHSDDYFIEVSEPEGLETVEYWNDHAIILTGDFNADGRDDLVSWQTDGNNLVLLSEFGASTGDRFNHIGTPPGLETVEYDHDNTVILPGDFDGDGKTDLVRWQTDEDNLVLLSNGDGSFRTINAPAGLVERGYWKDNAVITVVDLNADGKGDLVRWQTDGNNLVLLSNGDGNFTRIDSPVGLETVKYTKDKTFILSGDFNGDGKGDLVSWQTDGNNLVLLSEYNAQNSGQFNHIGSPAGLETVTYDEDDNIIRTGDFNGDGKTDLIRTGAMDTVVMLSKGDGSFEPVNLPDAGLGMTRMSFWGDFNGDGRTDVRLKVGYNLWRVLLAKGDGGFIALDDMLIGDSEIDLTTTQVRSGDFNGDGNMDLVRWQTDGDNKMMIWNSPRPLWHLTTIENKGARTTIEYKPSSNYLNKNLTFILNTVSSITTDDGLGNKSTTNFNYLGGYFDKEYREFSGFEYVTKEFPDGTAMLTKFHQDHFLSNKIDTILHLSGSNTLSETKLDWDSTDISGSESKFVRVTNKKVTTYDPYLYAPYYETVYTNEAYEYDSVQGNVTRVAVTGTGSTFQGVVTNKEYINCGAASGEWVWRLRRKTVEGVTDEPAFIRETEYIYTTEKNGSIIDDKGNLHGQRVVNNRGASPQTWMEYDAYGNIASNEDAEGNITRYEYDTLSNTYPVKTAPEAPFETLSTTIDEYDYRFGKVVQSTDENGNVTRFSYDEFGRVDQVYFNGELRKDMYYDIKSMPRKIVSCQKADASNTLCSIVYLDGLGRKVQSTHETMDGTSYQYQVVRYIYDNMGRNSVTVGPLLHYNRDFMYTITPENSTSFEPNVRISYDAHGRRTSVISSKDNYQTADPTVSYAYEGLTTTVTDPDGNVKKSTVNCYGKLVQVTEINGGSQYITEYAYNTAGDLISVIQKGASVYNTDIITQIKYNTLGQKYEMTDPDMGTWYYTYDLNGNLLTQTTTVNGIEQTTELAYDALNRMTSKKFFRDYTSAKQAIDLGSHVTYQYYNTSGLNNGRLYRESNADVTITYNAYDESGYISEITKEISGGQSGGYTTRYSYDWIGRLKEIEYPDSFSVGYEYYDNLPYLKRVYQLDTNLNYATFDEYDFRGARGSITCSNGVTTNYGYYDNSGRLKNIETTGNNQYQSLGYVYSLSGDITTITNGSDTYSYSYDDLHRLKTELRNNAQTVSYNYDQKGNFTSKAVGAETFAYLSNNSLKPPHAVHEIRGMTSPVAGLTKREITYNTESMPLSITDTINGTSVITQFVYGSDGKRVKKTVGNMSKLYIDNLYEVYITGSTAVTTKYIFAGDLRIAMIENGELTFVHQDHIGSNTFITDANMDLNNDRTVYMPFGENRNNVVQNIDYGFTDKELDSDTGLYNFDARLYDPAIGVFITPDTIVPDWTNPQTLNRYSYCYNNPLSYIDPDGHFAFGVLAAFVIKGAIYGAAVNGAVAAVTGGDIKDAMIDGAISGAIFGGIHTIPGMGTGLNVFNGVEGTAFSSTTQAAVHFGGGAVAGGISAARNGGDVGLGMLTGGISAGIGKFAGMEFLDGQGFATEFAGRTVLGGFTGGLSAELYGGDFADGFVGGARMAGIGYLCNDLNDILPGIKKALGGAYKSLAENEDLHNGLKFGLKASAKIWMQSHFMSATSAAKAAWFGRSANKLVDYNKIRSTFIVRRVTTVGGAALSVSPILSSYEKKAIKWSKQIENSK